jgi:hypothetical protein
MARVLNQAVRDYLEPVAGSHQLALDLRAFELSARETQDCLNGWRFDREEAHRRA